MRPRTSRRLAILCLLPAAGLHAQERASPGTPVVFTVLEDSLAGSAPVSMAYHVTSEGAFEADIRGRLELGPDNAVLLTGSGTFGGDPVDLRLVARDGTMTWGTDGERAGAPTPAHLREAVAVGFTRMGILHNLARLTANAPPDHGEGGVREWVVVDSFAARGGPDALALDFALTVAGQPSGTATLELGPDRRPTVRRQTVRFPGGEMRVTERYTDVRIGAGSGT